MQVIDFVDVKPPAEVGRRFGSMVCKPLINKRRLLRRFGGGRAAGVGPPKGGQLPLRSRKCATLTGALHARRKGPTFPDRRLCR